MWESSDESDVVATEESLYYSTPESTTGSSQHQSSGSTSSMDDFTFNDPYEGIYDANAQVQSSLCSALMHIVYS